MRDEIRGKRLIAAFLLGLVLFNFPALAITDSAARLMGLPALFLYPFLAWGLLIALLALLIERRG